MAAGIHRFVSSAALVAVGVLGCSNAQNVAPVADGATEPDTLTARDDTARDDTAVPGDTVSPRDTAAPVDLRDGAVVADTSPVPDTSAQPDGSTGDAAGISVTQVASAADLAAFLKAWCDYGVRCTRDYPTSVCDERRESAGPPEQYASEPLAWATACWRTLSCDGYAEDCIQDAAFATARSVPSRADLLGACWARDDECTGEHELSLMDCYWVMLLSEPMQPKLEACIAGACNQYRTCVQAVRQ